jgi:hypothetical protein
MYQFFDSSVGMLTDLLANMLQLTLQANTCFANEANFLPVTEIDGSSLHL